MSGILEGRRSPGDSRLDPSPGRLSLTLDRQPFLQLQACGVIVALWRSHLPLVQQLCGLKRRVPARAS